MQSSQDIHVRTTLSDIMRWSQELTHLHTRIAPRFSRPEPRRRALAYLQALLSCVERKNGWQIAQHAREARPYGMQRLLAGSVWNADLVRDDVRQYVIEQFGDPEAVLAIDETSFPKRGRSSAGVQVQYCGTTGQVQNCQVGVFLSYVSSKGHTLMDRELYLPLEWCEDEQRRQEANVPETVTFQTKPELAIQMLQRARMAHVPFRWVVADTVYGSHPDLRSWLEHENLFSVLAVPCFQPVGIRLPDGTCRQVQVHEVAGLLLTQQDWQRLALSEGSKGPRLFEWAQVPLLHQWQDDDHHRLLIRRSLTDQNDLAFFLVYAPPTTSLAQIVEVLGKRWRIEEHFQSGKDLGLDQYQVRSFVGWYRHITLVMLAHAFLRVICSFDQSAISPSALPHTAPLTVPEVRHLLGSLLWPPPSQVGLLLAWSAWRRWHRQQACFSHTRRRLKAG
jgi:SRSO17 transposase